MINPSGQAHSDPVERAEVQHRVSGNHLIADPLGILSGGKELIVTILRAEPERIGARDPDECRCFRHYNSIVEPGVSNLRKRSRWCAGDAVVRIQPVDETLRRDAAPACIMVEQGTGCRIPEMLFGQDLARQELELTVISEATVQLDPRCRGRRDDHGATDFVRGDGWNASWKTDSIGDTTLVLALMTARQCDPNVLADRGRDHSRKS